MSLRTRLHTLISRPIRAAIIAPLLVAGTLLTSGPLGAVHAAPNGFGWVSQGLTLQAGVSSGFQLLAIPTYIPSVNVALAPNPVVYWGDGTYSQETTMNNMVLASSGGINAEHTYWGPGIYTITIRYATGCCVFYSATTVAVVGGHIGGIAVQPFGRYFAPGVGHIVTTGLPPANSSYGLEAVMGYLLPLSPSGAPAGTTLLFGCRAGASDYFISFSPGCEGQTFVDHEGYIYNTPQDGLPTQALYRCFTGADHFVSTDQYCEGQTTEMLLGYAVL